MSELSKEEKDFLIELFATLTVKPGEKDSLKIVTNIQSILAKIKAEPKVE